MNSRKRQRSRRRKADRNRKRKPNHAKPDYLLRFLIFLFFVLLYLTIKKAIRFHNMVENIVPIMTGHMDFDEGD